MKFYFKLSFLFCCLALSACSLRSDMTTYSPNKEISFNLEVDSLGNLSYSLVKNQHTILSNSSLGFVAKQQNLRNDYSFVDISHHVYNKKWTQPWGENKIITNHYNESVYSFINDDTKLKFFVRVFDDGVGFRYEYQSDKVDSIFVDDELTSFNISDNVTSWSIPANFETYELDYRKLGIDELENCNTPVTFRTPDSIYFSIHEAALTNYPEMTLKKADGRELVADLAPWPDGTKAKLKNHFVTPWRVVTIGDEAVDLINSSIILNLNDPCVIDSTEWIRPMKYVGVWWGMHLGVQGWTMKDRHGATTENAIKYIDFARNHNIQGVLFEGWNIGWDNWGMSQLFNYSQPYADFDMDKISKYAKKYGIEIIGHHETGGNITNYEKQMLPSYDWYKSYGVNVLKTGYAGGIDNGNKHHGQFMVNHYRKVVELAADKKMMVDAHEPIKATGIRRTYPNMMTREGARGMEWNAWSEGNSPTYLSTLPFTRLLAGPMDYTPGTFDILFEKSRNSKDRKKWNPNDKGNSRVHTTLARQLANWVILYSPLQMASDMIENYEGHPAFQFFEDYNPDCDESKALAGEPGEFIVVVRKAGNSYFLGAGTNEKQRTVDLVFNFLEPNKTYKATIYADGAKADYLSNPTDYVIKTIKVDSTTHYTLNMAAGGGQAISFSVVD